MEIYPNQTFSEENFRRGYDNYFDYENSTIKEIWTPVLEETFKTCLEFGKLNFFVKKIC